MSKTLFKEFISYYKNKYKSNIYKNNNYTIFFTKIKLNQGYLIKVKNVTRDSD